MSRVVRGACVLVAALLIPALTFGQQNAGVEVKADGVLRIKRYQDLKGPLAKQWQADAKSKLQPDLSRVSEKRKISLNRLEKAIAEKLAAGKDIRDEMRYLAGITRVE